ncbi:MAG: zinc ribbon domain-containing protein [Thermoplasmata archaeon]|jgi:hypothetical protein
MIENRIRRALALGIAFVVVTTVFAAMVSPSFGASVGSVRPSLDPGTGLAPATNPTITSFQISPNPVAQGNQFSVTLLVSGGFPAYTYNWNPIPPFCFANNESSWQCMASQSGTYSVNVTVVDSVGNHTSAGRTLTVTSSNGNGNNNNNNQNGSNNNSGINLTGLGNILVYALVGGIISFVLLIVLTVGVLMIAVTLSRRLPRQPRGKMVCAACQGRAPAGSKFCPTCAAPLSPPTK